MTPSALIAHSNGRPSVGSFVGIAFFTVAPLPFQFQCAAFSLSSRLGKIRLGEHNARHRANESNVASHTIGARVRGVSGMSEFPTLQDLVWAAREKLPRPVWDFV